MGLSASQARLLNLTARMHDIEYKAQNLEAQKLQMANESTQVYQEYENALNKQKVQFKQIGSDGSANYVDANLQTLLAENYNIKIDVHNSFQKANLKLDIKNNYIFPINIHEKNFSTSVYLLNNLEAPLKENSKIGVLKLELNGKPLFENDILNVEFIDEIKFNEYFWYVIKEMKNVFI